MIIDTNIIDGIINMLHNIIPISFLVVMIVWVYITIFSINDFAIPSYKSILNNIKIVYTAYIYILVGGIYTHLNSMN